MDNGKFCDLTVEDLKKGQSLIVGGYFHWQIEFDYSLVIETLYAKEQIIIVTLL